MKHLIWYASDCLELICLALFFSAVACWSL